MKKSPARSAMRRFTVSEVLHATGGRLARGNRRRSFTGISIDSRTIRSGECFVAIRGTRHDGHRFCRAALKSGAACLVVEEGAGVPKAANGRAKVPVVEVADTLRALGDIAAAYRKRVAVPVVAITGSNGKTTCKEMTASILRARRRVRATRGNLNNLIGLPLSILEFEPKDEVGVFEMGMNRMGEIAELTRIAAPDVGVITNVTMAHTELLLSLEAVARAKGELFSHLPREATAVVNADDPWTLRLVNECRAERRITFGVRSKADFSASKIEQKDEEKVTFRLHTPDGEAEATLSLLGKHHVPTALAASAAAWSLGARMSEVVQGLARIRPTAGRMEIIHLPDGPALINDAYNANPESMAAAFRTLLDMKAAGKVTGRMIAALGDMLELGPHAEAAHRRLGALAAETGLHSLHLTGSFAETIAEAAVEAGMPRDAIHVFESPEAIGESLRPVLRVGDWLLIKGSRGMKMERVIEVLTR